MAGTNIPVLIHGESGSGKEIIAKYIHLGSPWAAGPFVKVNCPAIPDTLMESELFGYEKGAFTGAVGTKPGRVEGARCGTLFLDEISELALPLQSKLLQLLQDGRYCPIGSLEDKQVDLRVICATNRPLEHEVAAGRFRQDLYYRINVVPSICPPCASVLPISPSWWITFWSSTAAVTVSRRTHRPRQPWHCFGHITGREISANWRI